MQNRCKAEIAAAVEASIKEDGRYIYCVADAEERASLGSIGIAGNEVYTIPYKDICAVVHSCLAQPYQTDDQEAMKAWVMTHHKVVDAAWQRWRTVLPLSFAAIIKAGVEGYTEQKVQDWLKQEYEGLKRQMEKVRGKAEYGVQVFWDPRIAVQNLTRTSLEIRRLDEEIITRPRGLAYMHRQMLKNLIKRELEARADERFQDFFRRITKHTEDIRVEKTRNTEEGLQMLMNLSCLVYRDRYTGLGKELDKIDQMEGFSVRFTGPWPPYSFVGSA